MRRLSERTKLFTILAILIVIVTISPTNCGDAEISPPSPLAMVSTTLNEDGISGHNYFRASWKLGYKTTGEIQSLKELAWSIREQIESDLDANVRIWEDEHWLILETTVDFRDPSEIEGTLAIVYGRGYGYSDDISVQVREPEFGEFETMWGIEMTVNPRKICPDCHFEWKVNMPGDIEQVEVLPPDAGCTESRSGSRTVTLEFGAEDRPITASIEASETESRSNDIWPTVLAIVSSVVATAIVGIWRVAIWHWFVSVIRRRKQQNSSESNE